MPTDIELRQRRAAIAQAARAKDPERERRARRQYAETYAQVIIDRAHVRAQEVLDRAPRDPE